MSGKVAFAIAAHPDDIEFIMAGTLLLLREAGWEIHYLNVADGCCGSLKESRARTRARRAREGQDAANILGAHFHRSLVPDLEIYYEPKLLSRLAAVVREVNPSIVLTHSLSDYMEDHMNTARLAVTATFARGMPNFVTTPKRPIVAGDATVYHAMPHQLCDQMGRRIIPETYVDVSSTHKTKLAALAAHRSQQDWLDVSQGMNSYLRAMEDMSRDVGRMSGRFRLAEGWRRHSHMGFCSPEANPLADVLGKRCWKNPAYAKWLAG